MTSEIPSTMKRLVLKSPGKDPASCKLEVEEGVKVPKPSSGQVLIKVIASAINPSDFNVWLGCKPDECPLAIGNEGCGIVVELGEGSFPGDSVRVGSKVGFVNLQQNQGAYSEYVVADPSLSIFPMPEDLPIENAASFFVNPFTASAIMDTVKKLGAKAFVHTAAASQLGQMIVKRAPSEGLEVINVVRRNEQADLLKSIGARHVVVSSGDAWKDELKAKIEELGVTVVFDAVAGRSTADMLEVLPSGGTVYLYGNLAGTIGNINPVDVIYQEKQLKGFVLFSWINIGSTDFVARLQPTVTAVCAGLGEGGWSSSKFVDTTLENAHSDAIKLLESKSTGNKLRIRIGTP